MEYTCIICNETKPESEFHPSRILKRSFYCKKCCNAMRLKYYHATKVHKPRVQNIFTRCICGGKEKTNHLYYRTKTHDVRCKDCGRIYSTTGQLISEAANGTWETKTKAG